MGWKILPECQCSQNLGCQDSQVLPETGWEHGLLSRLQSTPWLLILTKKSLSQMALLPVESSNLKHQASRHPGAHTLLGWTTGTNLMILNLPGRCRTLFNLKLSTQYTLEHSGRCGYQLDQCNTKNWLPSGPNKLICQVNFEGDWICWRKLRQLDSSMIPSAIFTIEWYILAKSNQLAEWQSARYPSL